MTKALDMKFSKAKIKERQMQALEERLENYFDWMQRGTAESFEKICEEWKIEEGDLIPIIHAYVTRTPGYSVLQPGSSHMWLARSLV